MTFLFAAFLLAAPPAPVVETASLTSVRDGYPDLSPDGRTLLFHSNRSGRQAIWAAKADGSEPRILYDDAETGSDPGTPDWSPDGRSIVFAMIPKGAADENESEIYAMNADGSNLRRLTNVPGDDSHPHWSTSGRIFFNSARATPDLKVAWSRQWIDIYSMAADGSDIQKHTDCKNLCTFPSPSPNGRAIAYRAITETLGQNWDLTPGSRNSEVFVTPLGEFAPVNVSNSTAFDGWPTWSLDGNWVVFASNRDKIASTGQIYAVRPDGKDLRRLTRGSWSRVQPSFTTAGDRVLVYESIENADFELGHVASFAFDPGD